MYSGPVLALSVLLNIPKFYEIDVSRIVSMGGGMGKNFRIFCSKIKVYIIALPKPKNLDDINS